MSEMFSPIDIVEPDLNPPIYGMRAPTLEVFREQFLKGRAAGKFKTADPAHAEPVAHLMTFMAALFRTGRVFHVPEFMATTFTPGVARRYFVDCRLDHPYEYYMIAFTSETALCILVIDSTAYSSRGFSVTLVKCFHSPSHTAINHMFSGSALKVLEDGEDKVSIELDKYFQAAPNRDELYNALQCVCSAVTHFIHAVADGAAHRETIAPTKESNRLRVLRGKPRIPSHIKVTYVTPVKPAVPRPEPPLDVEGGGTHASPVPHERRGHYRTYKSGKQGWVRACTVNGKAGTPGGPGLPVRTHYEVKELT